MNSAGKRFIVQYVDGGSYACGPFASEVAADRAAAHLRLAGIAGAVVELHGWRSVEKFYDLKNRQDR